MKKLLVSADRFYVGFIRGALEAEGIRCVIKNEFLSGASGELPINETWPELWVSDADWSMAQSLVADLQQKTAGREWVCPRCGEVLEAQFTECWACAAKSLKP